MADTTTFDRRVESGAFPVGRVRWTVCAMLFVATSINYRDRQVIAILKPTLEHSIGMTEVSYGYIVDAFQIAPAIGLLAAGRLIDKLGTRIGYMLVMAVWGLSAMGHAPAGSMGSALFAFFAGHILQLTHSYASLFGIAASAYLLLWSFSACSLPD